ncbi:hypothetical protein GH714_017765 [Hevea brasiliensis]|uniref:Leucine-rich repeat-containing N-terminal plant-type domain-containing protein n=1 Tax=Hevea brasiliensis TaxID=3981 RepID=A0A6A6N4Z5_HEVBR|nr:hypothetical protein GH714_017765 [Hevea brasiliensis]
MSVGVGFAVGLLLPYFVFAMKRSWGGVYFALVDGTAYRLSRELVCGGTAQLVHCNTADREVLLDFKMGLEDSENRLSSWHGSNCCHWWGIACDNVTGAVITINLPNLNLGWQIKPSLTKLKSLTYLDLSSNTFNGSIPNFFSFLENLQYLNLSHAGFSGAIPPNLGNLSSLQFLDVSSSSLNVDNFEWLSGLVSLKYLSMNFVDLSKVGIGWVVALNKLPFLVELHLAGCRLSNFIYSLPSFNFSSLAVLDLGCHFAYKCNNFYSKLPNWLQNVSSLVSVDISHSNLRGRIPLGFSELPNLKSLDLHGNENLSASCSQLFHGSWKKIEILDFSSTKLHGRLPTSFGNMTSLFFIDLSWNGIKGEIPNSLGQLKNLTHLYLDHNLLQGPIPASIGNLKHLAYLGLSLNKLNGTLPESLGLLSELYYLDVSVNELTGVISEAHFLMLSKLKYLLLSTNSLIFNISSNWVPPFQILQLDIGSCHLGPSFPIWLRSQKEIDALHLSNCSISDSIPNWFWGISGCISLLDVSSNHLEGHLPNPLNLIPIAEVVDLSNNHFEGTIPLPDVSALDLSNNQFSGPVPKNIGQNRLIFLSLSGNQLTGAIPTSIGRNVELLDLSRNNLTGSIPSSIGNCVELEMTTFSSSSFAGNSGLCGDPLSLKCSDDDSNNGRSNDGSHGEGKDEADEGELVCGGIAQLVHCNAADRELLLDIKMALEDFENRLSSWHGSNCCHWWGVDCEIVTGTVITIDQASLNLGREIRPSLTKLKSLTPFKGWNRMVAALNKLPFFSRVAFCCLVSVDISGSSLHGRIPLGFSELPNLKSLKLYEGRLPNPWNVTPNANFVDFINNYFKGPTPLSDVLVLDLSNNQFSGPIPNNIGQTRLIFLSLSGNQLTGAIPASVGNYLQLLDLSRNNLTGSIPSSIGNCVGLKVLDLQNNNVWRNSKIYGRVTWAFNP